MEYRVLGKTGLKVSSLGIGTWQLSGPLTLNSTADGFPDPGLDKVITLINACGDLGINFIDSAEIYGDGEGERRIGQAIRGKRDQWILSTKFGLRKGNKGEKIQDSRPNTIRSSLENSLKRLQTDYVDIYLYHSPPDTKLISEGKRVLETLKQEGKIRFYGISTNDPNLLGQLVAQNAVDVIMFSQSLVNHPSKLLNLVKEHNLGTIIRGAFESGLLSGNYFHHTAQFSHEDIRKSALERVNTQKYAVYEKFIPEGVPMTTFALRYLMDFDTTQVIVLGGKSVEHYQNALKAFEFPALEPKTHDTLQKVRQKLLYKSLGRRIFEKAYQLFINSL